MVSMKELFKEQNNNFKFPGKIIGRNKSKHLVSIRKTGNGQVAINGISGLKTISETCSNDILLIKTNFESNLKDNFDKINEKILISSYALFVDADNGFDSDVNDIAVLTEKGFLYFYRCQEPNSSEYNLLRTVDINKTEYYSTNGTIKIQTEPDETIFIPRSKVYKWSKMVSKFSNLQKRMNSFDRSSLSQKIRRSFKLPNSFRQMVNSIETPSAINKISCNSISGTSNFLSPSTISYGIENPSSILTKLHEKFQFSSNFFVRYQEKESQSTYLSSFAIVRGQITRDNFLLWRIDDGRIICEINLCVSKLECVKDLNRTFRIIIESGSFLEVQMPSKELYDKWALVFLKLFTYHQKTHHVYCTNPIYAGRSTLKSGPVGSQLQFPTKLRSKSCPKLNNITKSLDSQIQNNSLYKDDNFGDDDVFKSSMQLEESSVASLSIADTFESQSCLDSENPNSQCCCDFEERFRKMQLHTDCLLPIRCTRHTRLDRFKSSCQNLSNIILRRKSEVPRQPNFMIFGRHSKLQTQQISSLQSLTNISEKDNELSYLDKHTVQYPINIDQLRQELQKAIRNQKHITTDEDIYLEPFTKRD